MGTAMGETRVTTKRRQPQQRDDAIDFRSRTKALGVPPFEVWRENQEQRRVGPYKPGDLNKFECAVTFTSGLLQTIDVDLDVAVVPLVPKIGTS
jgi:hypothetical protein